MFLYSTSWQSDNPGLVGISIPFFGKIILLSYNTRGLGSDLKRRAVKNIVSQFKIDLVCLQETKLQEVDLRICKQIWGEEDLEWEFVSAVNRGGGLLCI